MWVVYQIQSRVQAYSHVHTVEIWPHDIHSIIPYEMISMITNYSILNLQWSPDIFFCFTSSQMHHSVVATTTTTETGVSK